MTEAPEELLDRGGVRDIYADGIGAVEIFGDCVRVLFFAYRTPAGAPAGAPRQKVVVAKIVEPLACATDLNAMIERQRGALPAPRAAQ